MARYTGPRVRISRRFGVPIFGASKYLERKNYGPGMHGPKARRKLPNRFSRGSQFGYQDFAECIGSPLGMIATAGFIACLAFHFFNGIRHLLWDTGWGLDLPTAFRTGMLVIVLSVLSFAALAWMVFGGAA